MIKLYIRIYIYIMYICLIKYIYMRFTGIIHSRISLTNLGCNHWPHILWHKSVKSLVFSPPARWGLLDFMSVASSSSSSSSSSSFSSLFSSSFSSSSSPLFSSPLLVSSPRLLSSCSLPDLNHDHPRPVFPAGPQPRPSPPVFPAGPQPRVSPPSVPCRTSTTNIHAQCSLPDLNREYPRQVFPAEPHVGWYGTKNAR